MSKDAEIQQCDEVARLTAERDEFHGLLEESRRQGDVWLDGQRVALARAEAAEAEVARLRDALREIATKGNPDDAAFARAALGENA